VPDALAALGYDAARILFNAIKTAGTTDAVPVRDVIAKTTGFAGVTGSITIDSNRNAVKPAVVLRVKNGKLEYVETVKP
jgi:branched-chain amino acid transport system substrate-binding protein